MKSQEKDRDRNGWVGGCTPMATVIQITDSTLWVPSESISRKTVPTLSNYDNVHSE
jgi:hypothetical protein